MTTSPGSSYTSTLVYPHFRQRLYKPVSTMCLTPVFPAVLPQYKALVFQLYRRRRISFGLSYALGVADTPSFH